MEYSINQLKNPICHTIDKDFHYSISSTLYFGFQNCGGFLSLAP